MNRIVVKSLKYDGSVNRSWDAVLIAEHGTLILVEGSFGEDVSHPLLGLIRAGTLSTEYFWTDRWYSVFRFETASGDLLSYYCNINTPVSMKAGTISFIDLDIDVIVAPDFSLRVLDEDEFELHTRLYDYPPDIVRGARDGVEEVFRLVDARSFPFVHAESRGRGMP